MVKYEETSRQHFNDLANTYESSREGRVAAALYESALKKLDDSGCHSVLDVGCGTGTILSSVSARRKDMMLSGIDLSPEMARIATERLGEKAQISVCDICSEQVPWPENSFDFVICMTAFHHFPNPKRALAEMYRVSRPQGCVVICDVTSDFLVRQFLNSIYRVSRFVPILNYGDFRFYSESEFRRLLEECRFHSVEWERVPGVRFPFRGFAATATPSK